MLGLLSRSRLFRLFAGIVLVFLLLWAGFALTLRLIPTYGTIQEELSQSLPGDELLKNPVVSWNHALTINAPVEQVWPWVIQIGDDRAAFYSYTFIEKAIDPLPGHYNNADRVHEEWQQPAIGTWIIQNTLKIVSYQNGKWMLASAPEGGILPMGWTWLWHLSPTPDGRTRMNIHMNIKTPAEMSSPLITYVITMGGFVMERNMMSGLKIRAEGGGEPGWIEAAEIALWLAVLALGAAAAFRFVAGPRGRVEWKALCVGLAAVALLFVFTFLQPAVWLRLALVLILAAAVVWSWRAQASRVLPLPVREGRIPSQPGPTQAD